MTSKIDQIIENCSHLEKNIDFSKICHFESQKKKSIFFQIFAFTSQFLDLNNRVRVVPVWSNIAVDG